MIFFAIWYFLMNWKKRYFFKDSLRMLWPGWFIMIESVLYFDILCNEFTAVRSGDLTLIQVQNYHQRRSFAMKASASAVNLLTIILNASGYKFIFWIGNFLSSFSVFVQSNQPREKKRLKVTLSYMFTRTRPKRLFPVFARYVNPCSGWESRQLKNCTRHLDMK